MTEAERPIIGRDHDEIIVCVDEGHARGAVDEPTFGGPAEAAADAGKKIDVVGEVDVPFDADQEAIRLPVVA
jgi:hypothetical protein